MASVKLAIFAQTANIWPSVEPHMRFQRKTSLVLWIRTPRSFLTVKTARQPIRKPLILASR